MVDLSKRGSKKYTDINKFQSYELTHCIVYEMAIRNKNVIEIFDKLEYIKKIKELHPYLKEITDKSFVMIDENNTCGLTHKEKKIFIKLSECKFKDFQNEIEKLIDCNKSKKYRKNWMAELEDMNDDEVMWMEDIILYTYKYDGNIEHNFEDDTKLCGGQLQIIIKALEDDLVNNYLLYPEGYVVNYYGADEDYLHEVENKEKKDIGTTFVDGINESIYEGFHILQEYTNESNKTHTINQIIPNFKRKINNSNQIATMLNFSLPEDEIVEYVKHIKRTLDNKDVRIIKSPLELLGEELDKADNISNMCSKNSRDNEKCFDKRNGLSRTDKLADMFFIYDSVKAGNKKLDIMIEIDKYYDHDNKRKKSFSGDTYDKYNLIAKDYINNERYKELISGVKE